MKRQHFSDALISIISDLPRDMSDEIRYTRLLDAMLMNFPCDAAGLLRLEGHVLKPLAVEGLSEDTMGRRFVVDEHPRLSRLLHSREPVRFPADSKLPDPYDGLVETAGFEPHVHDCMGFSLYIDDRPWGVLTLDAVRPDSFDEIDPVELRTFISLSEATIKATQRIETLEATVVRERQVAQSFLEDERKNEIIGNSKAIRDLKDEIGIVAQSDLTVLILGETGVGKELVARQIHLLSLASEHPLIYVNCAALPENIAESELFGHVKGAFSGAIANRSGKFELAENATLFLDEIGELPLSIQAKLLRALQSGEIQRIGSDKHIQIKVRIIAATNRDLQEEIAKGRFRADLYHRLAVYPLHIPPLREHLKDVPLLAGNFLEANQHRFGVQGLRLTREAKQVLQNYDWPGNVRELEHLLSRASLKAISEQGRNGRTITIDSYHLDITEQDLNKTEIAKLASPVSFATTVKGLNLKDATDRFQSDVIKDRLEFHNNNQAAAARDLGLNRSNFYRLLKRLDIHEK